MGEEEARYEKKEKIFKNGTVMPFSWYGSRVHLINLNKTVDGFGFIITYCNLVLNSDYKECWDYLKSDYPVVWIKRDEILSNEVEI